MNTQKIVHNQLKDGIVVRVTERSASKCVFYMPHKLVVKENASTTKVRMVFDASARPHASANSINKCINSWSPASTLITGHISQSENVDPHTAGDLQKAFLQVGLREEDRDTRA